MPACQYGSSGFTTSICAQMKVGFYMTTCMKKYCYFWNQANYLNWIIFWLDCCITFNPRPTFPEWLPDIDTSCPDLSLLSICTDLSLHHCHTSVCKFYINLLVCYWPWLGTRSYTCYWFCIWFACQLLTQPSQPQTRPEVLHLFCLLIYTYSYKDPLSTHPPAHLSVDDDQWLTFTCSTIHR